MCMHAYCTLSLFFSLSLSLSLSLSRSLCLSPYIYICMLIHAHGGGQQYDYRSSASLVVSNSSSHRNQARRKGSICLILTKETKPTTQNPSSNSFLASAGPPRIDGDMCPRSSDLIALDQNPRSSENYQEPVTAGRAHHPQF